MKRSILIVMLDVMVLSVLSLNIGGGASQFLLPVHQWSSLIEQGMEKEEKYQTEIEQLKLKAQMAEEMAAQARDLVSRHKELQDAAIKQLDTLSEREKKANQKLTDAQKLAQQAELDAKVAAEKQRLAEEEAQKAAALKAEAEKQAAQAAERALEAEAKADVARQREAEIVSRIAEMEAREKVLQETTATAAASLTDTKTQLQLKKTELTQAEKARKDSIEREKEALAKAEEERKRAEELLVKARVAQEKAEQAEQQAQSSQKYISVLRDRIVELKLSEQEVRHELEVVSTDKSELQEELTSIQEERNQSVWIQRDNSMVGLQAVIVERDKAAGEIQTYKETLYLPLVTLGDKAYLISNFDQLGLSWWQIQRDDDVTSLQYTTFDLRTNEMKSILSAPIHAPLAAPYVCTIESPVGLAKPLRPSGMTLLKNERVQQALAFSPVAPDRSARVEITPMLNEQFLQVKTLKTKSLFSRREIHKGDYLLTETGRFIGVMVSSRVCYVLPETPPEASASLQIPIQPASEGDKYGAFVEQARELKKTIRKTSLPRG